ncbi:MAG TPA: aryl-sulfate sulfotransferase [Bryobacteraceae bacterium]|nr:aryl-sulfate sulfotransferase [Bryobacteraceae bacterium]
MKTKNGLLCLAGWTALLCAPAFATVTVSMTPSHASPQPLGTSITWTATGTDTASGPLTFQFNVTPPGGSLTMVKDFNVGTLSGGTWTAQPFVWVPTLSEGIYKIEVVVKDFATASTTSKTFSFTVTPLVSTSTPVVTATANPLVALFSSLGCAKGSKMRVSFHAQGSTAATLTNYVPCRSTSMNFEIAGMYQSTVYTMFAETLTNGKITKGTSVNFTTGALPTNINFPSFKIETAPVSSTDTAENMLLINTTQLGGQPLYPNIATNLAGKIMWYYLGSNNHGTTITRPLANSSMLTIQYGPSWNTVTSNQQLLRQIDLAGNIIKETNTGVVQQELRALGAVDGGPCNVFSSPPLPGAACLDTFSHDAIQYTIGTTQYTAVLCDIEKIFPAGTQGDTSGYPVDIRGIMIVVLDSNWQAVWYWDSFDPDGGGNGYPLLPVSRVAALNEECAVNEQGCEGIQLLGTGVAPLARDWLHSNSIYYWGTDTTGGTSGAFVWSSRDQDWVMKVDYGNGTGTKNLLWTMGVCSNSFTFQNIYNDPWPWYSGQHEVAMENNGAGPLTIFDDGNTRVSTGASKQCMNGVGGTPYSRGMALSVDETNMTVTPVLSQNLGSYSPANGSAQMLSNGNFFFLSGVAFLNINTDVSYSIEIFPTPGTDTGTTVYNIQGPEAYRGWRMANLYAPPTT